MMQLVLSYPHTQSA